MLDIIQKQILTQERFLEIDFEKCYDEQAVKNDILREDDAWKRLETDMKSL